MRIKNLPSIESMDGSQDALVIEQTDGSEDKSRKVSPAQIKQYVEAGDFEATGEVKDGHGNILKDMAKSADVDAEIGDLSQTGLTGDSVAEQLTALKDIKCSVSTYSWGIGSVTAGGVYELSDFKNTVGLSDKNIVAVGLVSVAGSGNYDYGAAVIFSSNFVRIKITLTQSNTTARLYIIYTD